LGQQISTNSCTGGTSKCQAHHFGKKRAQADPPSGFAVQSALGVIGNYDAFILLSFRKNFRKYKIPAFVARGLVSD
jgi:hypothetical protein